MPAKIRLQRHGRKSKPFYHIVVADSRSPRDGKFIDKLGIYNPLSNPSFIKLNIENSISWLEKGAQPTNTVRSIFSNSGVLYKKHLLKGVNKGSFDRQEAEKKFQLWIDKKKSNIKKDKFK